MPILQWNLGFEDLSLVVYFGSPERDPLGRLTARRRHARFHVAKTRVRAVKRPRATQYETSEMDDSVCRSSSDWSATIDNGVFGFEASA